VPDPPTPSSSNSALNFFEDFEVGDISSTQFTTSDLPWTIDDEFASTGAKSIKNALTKRGQSSKLILAMDYPTDGLLLFDLRHDVFMPWAKMDVTRDGVKHLFFQGHEGPAKWEQHKIPVTQGFNEIVWDVSTIDAPIPPNPQGASTVWIDDVRYFATRTIDFDDDEFDKDLVSFSGLGRWSIDDSLPGPKTGLAAHSPKGLLPGESSTMIIKWTSSSGGPISCDIHLGIGKVSFFVDDQLEYTENRPGKRTQNIEASVGPGEHILSWKYEPPPMANMPMSVVWVDNVVLV